MLQACEVPASQNEHSHYVCTDNGEVKCLRGWTGDVCDVPICRKGCDPLQGYCKRPGECLCKLGMMATDDYSTLWQIHHPPNTLMHTHVDFSIYKEINAYKISRILKGPFGKCWNKCQSDYKIHFKEMLWRCRLDSCDNTVTDFWFCKSCRIPSPVDWLPASWEGICT